ncbi:hypothetical protein, partial [Methanoregula sp.]|uniref:hypothetical protein n=1 Tax=Methanoregula sp. TaxID=2052170 RepID=UPI003C783E5D
LYHCSQVMIEMEDKAGEGGYHEWYRYRSNCLYQPEAPLSSDKSPDLKKRGEPNMIKKHMGYTL